MSDNSTIYNTYATQMNTDIMLITSVVSSALFILSEVIPFLSPPQKGVCQVCVAVGQGIVSSLGALVAKPVTASVEL